MNPQNPDTRGSTSQSASHNEVRVPSQGERLLPMHVSATPTMPSVHPGQGQALTLAVQGSPAQGSSQAIDPWALLRAFQRRWMLAISLGLVGGVTGASLAWFLVPAAKYTATSQLYLRSAPLVALAPTKESKTDFGMFQRTQVSLIKGPVLEAVVRRPEVSQLGEIQTQTEPIDWLKKQLVVSFVNGSEILEISMESDFQESPATIVNAVTDVYLKEFLEVENKERHERLEMLKGLYRTYQDSLAKKRIQLKELIDLGGGNDKQFLSQIKQFEVERDNLIRKNLINVREQLITLEAQLEVRNQNERNTGTPDLLDTEVITEEEITQELQKDSEIRSLSDRLERLRDELARTARIARVPGSEPATQQLYREIRTTESTLKERMRHLRPQVLSHFRGRAHGATAKDDSLALRDEIRLLKRLEERYLGELKEIKNETREVQKKSVDYKSLEDEIRLNEATTQEVGDEIRRVELNADLLIRSPSRPVIQKAETPRTKNDRKRIQMVMLCGLGLFGLALAGITFWEYQSKRVGCIEDVVNVLGISVVGALPLLPPRSSAAQPTSGRLRDLRWKHTLIESIDATRAMLIHATKHESLRVVMVTSANVGEGKTSLSGHLATSLARSGRRTLLIDGDLRRPTAHSLFSLPVEPGLSDYLRGQQELIDLIRPTMIEGLWMITAGVCNEAALMGLSRRDLRSAFETLKQDFDYVIIDSAPLLPVADTLIIGQQVDAVLFSILNDVSRIPEVITAYARLGSLGIRVLGAVMAGTPTNSYYRSTYSYEFPHIFEPQSQSDPG